MKHLILSGWLIILSATGCLHNGDGERRSDKGGTMITSGSTEASGPSFTHDEHGVPVLCWTEKIDGAQEHVMKFAAFDTVSQRFGEPKTVSPSQGTRAHDESMNKIAFKKDGTIVAVYAVKHPVEENRFAGSIMYTLSSDGGQSWTNPGYLHDDTVKTYGRSFFDLTRLPDGEAGVVWLDGRFGEKDTGSAIFFDKTAAGGGFGKDNQIGETTCECCRTDIYTDSRDNIHVAWRDILFPPSLMGQQVRDMVHSTSLDGGKSFSDPVRISEDNWAIEGCPHTGPSLAFNSMGLHVVWFTASGNDPGIYYTGSADFGESFYPRKLVSKTARHPQMIARGDQGLLLVWDEISSPSAKPEDHNAHEHHQNPAQGSSQIIMQVRNSGMVAHTVTVTAGGKANVSHPVVTLINKHKALVVWTGREQDRSAVFYRVMDVEHEERGL